jgi:hypothetical protein
VVRAAGLINLNRIVARSSHTHNLLMQFNLLEGNARDVAANERRLLDARHVKKHNSYRAQKDAELKALAASAAADSRDSKRLWREADQLKRKWQAREQEFNHLKQFHSEYAPRARELKQVAVVQVASVRHEAAQKVHSRWLSEVQSR